MADDGHEIDALDARDAEPNELDLVDDDVTIAASDDLIAAIRSRGEHRATARSATQSRSEPAPSTVTRSRPAPTVTPATPAVGETRGQEVAPTPSRAPQPARPAAASTPRRVAPDTAASRAADESSLIDTRSMPPASDQSLWEPDKPLHELHREEAAALRRRSSRRRTTLRSGALWKIVAVAVLIVVAAAAISVWLIS